MTENELHHEFRAQPTAPEGIGAYFLPWVTRLLLVMFFLVFISSLVNIYVAWDGRQQTLQNRERGNLLVGLECETVMTLNAPIPPICFEPQVRQHLPAEYNERLSTITPSGPSVGAVNSDQ